MISRDTDVERAGPLTPRIGETFAVSDWFTIDQARIDRFAACTEDLQWIHTDQARAAAGPFGGTIAHGFLVLSLLPHLTGDGWLREAGIAAALHYGLDRVRLISPVRAGARIRNHAVLVSTEAKTAGVLLLVENTMEVEGDPKPALIASTLVLAIS